MADAEKVFRILPSQLQLASLHPQMVNVDAQRDSLLAPVNWCFRFGDQILLHCFHLGSNPDLGIADVQSAYGYGGPLSNSDDCDFLQMADHAFEQWAHEHAVVAEFLRFHPLVPHKNWYSGEIAENRETVLIDLRSELLGQYQNRRRTDVRRFVESGIKVERVSPQAMKREFPDIYFENMKQVGATRDYYFPESFFTALFQFGMCENWLAFAGSRAVAGAVILASPIAQVAEYFLGAQAKDAEQAKATIGLLHVAATYYKSLDFKSLYLGGGRSIAENDSLLFFKKGFSANTAQFQTGSKVYASQHYLQLKNAFPEKAATGHVLFYKS